MKAVLESTDSVVPFSAPTESGQFATVLGRVWEGVTTKGVPFTAYISMVQVHKGHDQVEFEKSLREHSIPPSDDTRKAIDARLIL